MNSDRSYDPHMAGMSFARNGDGYTYRACGSGDGAWWELPDGTILESDEREEKCWACGRDTRLRCTIIVPISQVRPGPAMRRLACCSDECLPRLREAYMVAMSKLDGSYYAMPPLDHSVPWAGPPRDTPMTAWQEIRYVWKGVFG